MTIVWDDRSGYTWLLFSTVEKLHNGSKETEHHEGSKDKGWYEDTISLFIIRFYGDRKLCPIRQEMLIV